MMVVAYCEGVDNDIMVIIKRSKLEKFDVLVNRTHTAREIWHDRNRNGSIKPLTWNKNTSMYIDIITIKCLS